MEVVKSELCAAAGIILGFISALFGGWSGALDTLLIFMALDYLTGVTAAGVFRKSTKTSGGGLESKAGWKGLCRKGVTLVIVMASYRLDMLIGTAYIKDAVIIAFCCNELLSIIENAALMGVPIPNRLKNAIEILKKETDNEDN